MRSWQIHHPRPTPDRIAGPYPSHLHIDLLPRLQGRGIGRQLIGLWLATVKSLGSTGRILGVGPANTGAPSASIAPAAGGNSSQGRAPAARPSGLA